MSLTTALEQPNGFIPGFLKGAGAIAVDSLKARIPLELVKIKEPNLIGDQYLVNESTGDITSDQPVRKNEYQYCGPGNYRVNYKIESMNLKGSGPVENFLTIGVNSKILENDYLSGINPKNQMKLFNQIQKQGIVDMAPDSFFDKSSCTDIDLKVDANYPTENFESELRAIFKSVKPSKRKGDGARLFTKKNNMGIEFSHRKNTAFRQQPYLKVYHKSIELMSRSEQFLKTHLRGQPIENLIRMETNIKNRKHFKHLYGHSATSMAAIINMPQEDYTEAFKHSIGAHMDQRKIIRIERPGLSPQKEVMKRLMELLYQNGEQIEYISLYSADHFEDKNTRYRMRKLLRELHHEIQKKEKKEAEIKNLFELFNLAV